MRSHVILALAALLAPGPPPGPDPGPPRPKLTVARAADAPARFHVTVAAPTRRQVEIVAPIDGMRARLAITTLDGLVPEMHRRSPGLVLRRDRPRWEPFPAGASKEFDVSPTRQYPDLEPGRY